METKEPSEDGARHFPRLILIVLTYLLFKPVVSVQVYCRRLSLLSLFQSAAPFKAAVTVEMTLCHIKFAAR